MSTLNRADRILEMVKQGKCASEIARELNCDQSYVHKTAKKHGLRPVRGQDGPKPAGFDPIVNRLAEQIGRDLYVYREMTNGYSYPEMAARLNMTVPKLLKAESGQHVLTLPELMRIASELGKPLPELMAERSNKVRSN